MRHAQIIFDVTETTTTVTATSSRNGRIDKMDITNTVMENIFINLLKKIKKEYELKQIVDTININNWEEL